MKTKIALIFFLVIGLVPSTKAQITTTVDCDLTGMVINVGSDTNYLNIYHSGHYLTHPQESNVIAWKITDMQGNIISQDTLIDQAFYSFYHNTPITDTMNVSAHLTNDFAIHEGYPVNCLVEDQVYWETTEIIPGSFTGSWSFIHNNVGVDQNTTSTIVHFQHNKNEVIKIVDMLGREPKNLNHQTLFYIYDNGKVEKKINFE